MWLKHNSPIFAEDTGFNPGSQSDPFNQVLRDNRLGLGPEDSGPRAGYTMEPIFVSQLLSSGGMVRSREGLCSATTFSRKRAVNGFVSIAVGG
ncbi:hypothetical protein CDAR_529921 [Caerostris darwini]|uniref:Uncharacterized protein n=1 Tax=Caerostris darwini TaxID=1538125 RepID=A0AAV4WXF1_9ARAC|nr:hypothetical protein CDAR_529921 [Caerostris darwini]